MSNYWQNIGSGFVHPNKMFQRLKKKKYSNEFMLITKLKKKKSEIQTVETNLHNKFN